VSGKASSTRAAILQHAADRASTDGLEGLTIGGLASELEMSKSGLFAHFGSKEGLQLAVVEHAAMRFLSEVVAPAQQAREGEERLRAYCERYFDYLQRKVFAGGCFWAAAAAEFDDRPGPVRDAIANGVRGWLGELERHARLAGCERPAELAFEIYSLGLGANACARLLADEHAFARTRATVERLLGDDALTAARAVPAAR
jgi:AcrR family transcriptional regulator